MFYVQRLRYLQILKTTERLLGLDFIGKHSKMSNFRNRNNFRNYDGMNSQYVGGYMDCSNMNSYASADNMMRARSVPILVNCGELREQHSGALVEMTGKFNQRRIGRFAELRDKHGVTQLVIDDQYPKLARRFANMPRDSVITIIGNVLRRPNSSRNQSMPTGDIEINVEDIVNYEVSYQRKGPQKRSYSTMTQEVYRGITSSEFKMCKTDNITKYFDNRELTCNDLRLEDVGKTVQLVGWLVSFNSSKFQQLKDGYGLTQIVLDNSTHKDLVEDADGSSILLVKGRVVARPVNSINLRFETGEIEVFVEDLKILDPELEYDGPIKKKNSSNNDGGNAKIVNQYSDSQSSGIHGPAEISKYTYRTHNCGELSGSNNDQDVVLCGWLGFQRMSKFIVLRDGYGETQAIIPDELQKNFDVNQIPLESIVKIEGKVVFRPANMKNTAMKTGEVEIVVKSLEVLNNAKTNLPIEVREFNRSKEALRLEYRYIDLRFRDMQKNLRTRSAVIMKMREFLINRAGFVEVETPTLFRRTPGGAQEFVVPTRKAEHFYSLVQSPQQFKQMLMAGAIDRYFQVARCYRDEATRPDRQPEFTQLDIELSFTTRDKIMQLIEELLVYCLPKEMANIDTPFAKLTYDEAMETYGNDKPDTSFDLKLRNVTEILSENKDLAENKDFGAYAIVGRKPFNVNTNATKKSLGKIAENFKGKFLTSKVSKSVDDWVKLGLSKLLSQSVTDKLAKELALEKDDLVLLAYGTKEEARSVLGRIRLDFIENLEASEVVPKRNRSDLHFLWVTDFPMFAENPDTNVLETVHHPFTAPHEDDEILLKDKSNLTKVRSQAYDLVLNGQEIGGGSIRIHDHDLQLMVINEILKIEHSHLQHLLDALNSGCPPHGGIALGLDRFIAILCETPSIRDVIAFPKTLNGKDLLSKAPVQISEEEKELYHITTVSEIKEEIE